MDTPLFHICKIFIRPEVIGPIVVKLAQQCGQDGTGYRLELYAPVALGWHLCGFAAVEDFNAARAAHDFADRIFEELAASGELPPSPQSPGEPISREDMIANLMNVARFRLLEKA
jgi:hypothetical protein